MFYFIRTALLYILLFAGASYAVQKGFEKYYLPEDLQQELKDNPSGPMAFVMPRHMSAQRDTQTGLILSGMVAQSRRDWDAAWKNFSALNDKFEGNPDIALRAFTLAMGNGSYKQADAISKTIEESYLEKKQESQTIPETFDLVWLYRALRSIKQDAMPEVLKENLDDLGNGALSRFASPVIRAWTLPNLDISKEQVASSIQTYYMALAKEFYDEKEQAFLQMQKIEGDVVTLKQMQHVVAFYVRLGNKDHAIKLLKNAIKNMVFVEDAEEMLTALSNDNYIPPEFSSYHLDSKKAGIALAFHDFSRILMGERALDSALLFARMAAYVDSNIPSIDLTIGDILKFQNQNDSALKSFMKVPEDDPLYTEAVAQQTNLLLERKEFKQAQKILESVLDKQPDNAYLHYILGNVYKENKRFKQAVDQYDLAEKQGLAEGDLDKNLWPLYYSRAIAYDLSDDWPKAEQDLLKALEKFPDSPIVLNYLGYAYADRGISLEKAKDMILRAVMAAPQDAYIIDSMGWILYQTQDYDNAILYLERAASLRPYHMVINDHLGDVYWKQGRKIEAYYMWQRALDYFDETDEEQQRMIDDTRRKVKEGLK